MSTQTLGRKASSSTTKNAKIPPTTTTFIAITWEYVQQALELCAGISELDPKNATHSVLKQLGSDLSWKIQGAITMHTIASHADCSTRHVLPVVTNSPAERFKVRKRAVVASEKLSNLKKAVARADKEINLFTKNHGTGRPAVISPVGG